MSSGFDVISPVDGSRIATREYIAESSVLSRLESTARAQRDWANAPLFARLDVCRRFLHILADRSRELREDLTWAIGRPSAQTAGEFSGLRERADYLIDIAEQSLCSSDLPAPAGTTARMSRVPCGSVLLIAPWNYPYLTAINSLIPAVAAGNAAILKHSPRTPTVAEAIVDAFRQAGAPEHLVSFMHCSDDQTRRLIGDRRVDHVVFTGSVAVGRVIGGIAGSALVGCTLELGGKDAAYVREDADLGITAAALADGAFFNAGQSCCAIERIYAHKKVYRELVEALHSEASKLRLGDPRDGTTTLGPVISDSAASRIRKQVHQALARGARQTGTRTPSSLPSNYLEPQVLTDVDHSMSIMREETFGPTVGVMAVDSDAQAIELMNDSNYGLTGSVWTRCIDAATRIGSRLETGTWFMNRCDYLAPCLPWSGRKASGVGCSLSHLGYAELTRPKSALLAGYADAG